MIPGQFTLVLHTHLPWLAHHGRWPVGEEWLYQSWSACYLPLVRVLRALTAENAALKARVVELEDALEPFARRADTYDPPEDDDWVVDWYDSVDRPTLGNFRLARAALEKSHE